MENKPDDLAYLIETERKQAEEAVLLVAQAEQNRKDDIASTVLQERILVQDNIDRAELLQVDATKVMAVATGRVPYDARIGRILPRTVGWVINVASVSHHNDGEGYQARSWNLVEASILTPSGQLNTTNPVTVKLRDYPLTTRKALLRVLQRSSGIQEISSVDSLNFAKYRQQLAKFVIQHGLKI